MSPPPNVEPDWLLRLSYPRDRRDLEDVVERILFLSCSAGSSIEESGDRMVVRLYFTSRELRDDAAAMVPDSLDDIDVVAEEAEKIDWLEFYEHSLEPIEIGTRWVVVPDRRLLPEAGDRIPIVIPQERAFGTGAHETTALCLAMMETMDLAGSNAADIGTGSGILAIGMQKLGARRVVAFDNDPETWGVVLENMSRNGVPAESIELFFGTVDALRPGVAFDVVVMNIIPEVILPSLPTVTSHLAPDGIVLFSGILTDRAPMVVEKAAECGLGLVAEAERGEWWCGKLKMENAPAHPGSERD